MSSYAKGEKPRDLEAAQGGSVLGRTRDFLKQHDEFRDRDHGKRVNQDVVGETADTDNKFAKSGPGAGKGYFPAPPAKGKQLAAVKPRS